MQKEKKSTHMTEKKNKHMTLEDRIEIQTCLRSGMTFKAIARRVGKDPTTVSREVKARSAPHRSGFSTLEEACPLLLKAPFVCNGCAKRSHASCRFVRRIYTARAAQEEYEATLTESREGIPLQKASFYQMDALLTQAIRSGQSVYHAIHAHDLHVSQSSVYRYIHKGYCSAAPLDLPRAVNFKPRRQAAAYVPRGARIGRSFQDFQAFSRLNPSLSFTEMDTVIGRPGGKVIMTFQFVPADFMFGLLLDNKSAAEAAARITAFKARLDSLGLSFGELFPALLTDNGGEFSCVSAFENNAAGEKETSVFFCDPNAPYQKPHVENNHALLRTVLPPSSSFDDLTQRDVNLLFSHVNALIRKQFHGKSAYDVFSFLYSAPIAAALGVSFISPEAVQLSRSLRKAFSK